ncbi:hypothetical protein PMAYCL1PPCAC_23923 [Pristionchus mayeri]|uniref:Elongator complex protein 1 n=1 Tax=Pristionchus mayeri TaxID=1317129 RepID=A0AAN5I661_9BILA|nr:hypothetical protein PMAYCL1PPCAC_23923 [Pristionchus mayeri]
MRSLAISSIISTQLACEGGIIGVESLPHLGLSVVASSSTVIFISNSQIIREVKWSEMDREKDGDKVVVFGVIEGRIVCIYSSGMISCVDCDSGQVEQSMLPLEGEIVAGAINPVTSVIALIVSNGTSITMAILDPNTQFFHAFLEGVDVKTREAGLDELVTVGWGSEKSQFQGKAGKAERGKKTESGIERRSATRGCRLVWREDGEVFLVNYYDSEEEKRECAIWNVEGQLISRILSEYHLEEWSAFKPMGNMIGVASEGRVIMAERNGEMRNGVIRVDEVIKGGRIKEGAWNCDASILVLQVEKSEDTLTHYLTLWTCANLDWTCKLVVPFEGSIPAWRWNPERWNELMVVSPSNELFTLNFALPFHTSNGVVATMGTCSLRLTNLNRVILPPPLAETFETIAPPSALFLSSSHLLAITLHRFIYHYSISVSSSTPLSTSLLFSFPVSIPTNAIISSISLINDEYAVGFTHHSTHYIAFFDCKGLLLRREVVHSAVISTKKEKDDSLSLLLADRSIHNELNHVEGPSNNSILAFHQFSESGMGVYTLDYSSQLFHNGTILSNDVSSFTYSDPFIAWIDNSFNLHVTDTLTSEKAEVRRVEKGARLVCVAPPKVILQMPRGNLETIHSRFFVIRSVRSLLGLGEVKNALIHMRKHGISFSLLKEFSHFFSSSIDWLCGMEDGNLLSLVITELISIPECTAYCDMLVSSILSLPSVHILRFFPCILTALLLSKPWKAETAFRWMVDHLPKNTSRSSTLRHWLQVCSSFMNSSQIFKSSLSTYDLPFVVEVVEALSIDPNEYMHILRELNELDDLFYRAYKMDVLREDFGCALDNLCRSSPPRFGEIVEVIKSKSLYAIALRIYGDLNEKDPLFNTIGRLALEYFSKEGKWKEAAIIGRSIGEYEEEMKLREKMTDVEGWVTAIELSGIEEDERTRRMNEWKHVLVKGGKWNAAAALINHMKCGWEERMEVREMAKDWKGMLCDAKYDRNNNAEKRGREILKRRSDDMEREIQAEIGEIERLSNRLNVVREKKREMIARMENGDIGLEDLERCDAFSESSLASSRSHSSRSSRASSVSRRTKKIEKKKGSLKEGGEWEDAAILIVCHAHWKTCRELFSESVYLLPSLVSFRLFSSLSSLSTCLDRLECTLISHSSLIWPSKLESYHLTGPLSHIYEGGCMSSEGRMPSFITIDHEMNPPPPLNEKEKEWRINL